MWIVTRIIAPDYIDENDDGLMYSVQSLDNVFKNKYKENLIFYCLNTGTRDKRVYEGFSSFYKFYLDETSRGSQFKGCYNIFNNQMVICRFTELDVKILECIELEEVTPLVDENNSIYLKMHDNCVVEIKIGKIYCNLVNLLRDNTYINANLKANNYEFFMMPIGFHLEVKNYKYKIKDRNKFRRLLAKSVLL